MPDRTTATRTTKRSKPDRTTPDPAKADRTKVLSVRFTVEEFEALSARAVQVGVGPSTLARTFVRQALAGPPTSTPTSTPTHPTPSPDVPYSPFEAELHARLEALVAADLVTRVEALEALEALERRTGED